MRYIEARRRAGSTPSRVRLESVQYLGPAPNPRLKDADGWRFRIQTRVGEWVPFTIWMSGELLAILRHGGYEVGDLLMRGAERLAEDEMIRLNSLPSGHSIELLAQDRLRLLMAAGRAPDFLLPGEAELEDGVPVLYEFGASGFDFWVGDNLPVIGTNDYVDAVIDWSYSDGRRSVRTIRLQRSVPDTRSDMLRMAVRAYRARCERMGEYPGEWLAALVARVDHSAGAT
jgi:hypothetical protein